MSAATLAPAFRRRGTKHSSSLVLASASKYDHDAAGTGGGMRLLDARPISYGLAVGRKGCARRWPEYRTKPSKNTALTLATTSPMVQLSLVDESNYPKGSRTILHRGNMSLTNQHGNLVLYVMITPSSSSFPDQQLFGATPFGTGTRSSQEWGKWLRCLAWLTNAVNLPGLEVIKGCSPHRALRPLRQPLSGALACPFVLGAAGGLPFATPFVQLFVPVFSLLETSMEHDSPLSKSMENLADSWWSRGR